jgi:uncharacterized iron-regulated protein
MKTARLLPLIGIPLLFASCSGLGVRGADYRLYELPTGEEVELDQLVAKLATADVVFLGEEHDNDVGHDLQLWTIRQLHRARPDLIVSMEQFEADVQGQLNLFLGGAISEEEFLATSRPWPNYGPHYRPIVEFARERNLPVVAANIPRPLASQVAHRGLDSVGGKSFVPWFVWTDEPEYSDLFAAAMGQAHQGGERSEAQERWFAAQCIKDEMMAESIAGVLASGGEGPPLVVHLCGKFHSDYHLGTVSRLKRRRPDLKVAVVSMESDDSLWRDLSEDEKRLGEFLWVVRPQD